MKTKFNIELNKEPFGIKIFRKDTNEIIFEILPGELIYS